MTETRQKILTTAAQLFAERGYELVGINEIIEKSGVAKATFYSNFKSKENLCAEWLKAEAGSYESHDQDLLKRPLTAIDKVRRKFEGLGKHVKATNYRGCSFSITASMVEPGTEVREVIRDFKANTRTFWQSLALELNRDPVKARALGDTLFILYSGAITEAQNARHIWPVDSAKAAAVSLCEATI